METLNRHGLIVNELYVHVKETGFEVSDYQGMASNVQLSSFIGKKNLTFLVAKQ